MSKFMQPFGTVLGLLLCLTGLAQSVPQLINFQGQLLDAAGDPMPAGDYTIEVRLFPVESGGVVVWGPQIFDGQGGVGYGPKASVVDGRFNLVLGPQDTNTNDLASVFAVNPSVYIELKVGTANPISPRQQVLSTPFALHAAHAQNASTAALATTATTAQNADNAANAANAANAENAAKLNGYDWAAMFSGGNPAIGSMSVASLGSRGDLSVAGNAVVSGRTFLNGPATTVQGILVAPTIGINMYLNDWGLYLRGNGDNNHFLKWGSGLGNQSGFDGPMLVGNGGGVLGSVGNWSLRWNSTGTVQTRGAISSGSDRNIKENFTPVDADDVLARVAALPVTRWNYKDDPSAQHIGPVAQDFRAAFGLGSDDKFITTVDVDGVALTAIQALNRKVAEKEAEIQQLEQRLGRLERLLSDKTPVEP